MAYLGKNWEGISDDFLHLSDDDIYKYMLYNKYDIYRTFFLIKHYFLIFWASYITFSPGCKRLHAYLGSVG